MATEFDNTSSIQEVLVKATDSYIDSQDIELTVYPKNPDIVELTVSTHFSDSEIRTNTLEMSYDDMWEHIHNCLHAMNALKEKR
jgi:hypothetical protein